MKFLINKDKNCDQNRMSEYLSESSGKYSAGFGTIVGIVTLAAVASLLTLALLIAQTDTAYSFGAERDLIRARAAADSCAEYAISQLRADSTYAGNETVALSADYTCIVEPTGGSGNNNRTVQVTGQYENNSRRVEVQIEELVPDLLIDSWTEVGSF